MGLNAFSTSTYSSGTCNDLNTMVPGSTVLASGTAVGPTGILHANPNAPKHVPMTLPHLVHYSYDEMTHEYITTRIVMPSGINLEELDRVVEVNVSEDGMSLIVIIEWPRVLTDADIIKKAWSLEEIGGVLTEGMRTMMAFHINSDVLLIKQGLNLAPVHKIKGICSIRFKKECERNISFFSMQSDHSVGGLLLIVLTKVRVRANQVVSKKLKITKIMETDDLVDRIKMAPPTANGRNGEQDGRSYMSESTQHSRTHMDRVNRMRTTGNDSKPAYDYSSPSSTNILVPTLNNSSKATSNGGNINPSVTITQSDELGQEKIPNSIVMGRCVSEIEKKYLMSDSSSSVDIVELHKIKMRRAELRNNRLKAKEILFENYYDNLTNNALPPFTPVKRKDCDDDSEFSPTGDTQDDSGKTG